MFTRILRRRAPALLTAAAAAAAVLGLAVPAGASTGTTEISPEQAGYTATGAQFKSVLAEAYMRDSTPYRGVVAHYGHSVQLWSSALVVTLGVRASMSGQTVYSPNATIYNRSTHQIIASNPNGKYCTYSGGCSPEGEPYQSGGYLYLTIRYSPATGQLDMEAINPGWGSYGQDFDFVSSYTITPQSFTQARVGTDFGTSPWDASYSYTPPATSLKGATYHHVTLTTYSGHQSTLRSWWVHHKLFANTGRQSGSDWVATSNDLYDLGASFQTWLVPASGQSSS
jgi:hypothetical protein